MQAALVNRWSTPNDDQKKGLGQALWQDFLVSTVGELLPDSLIKPLLPRIVNEGMAREMWDRIARPGVEAEILRLRGMGLTLLDVVGEAGAEGLRRESRRAREPNRELVGRILDQPLLKQALRETLQNGIQQFLGSLGDSLPFGRSEVGPSGGMARGVLGEVGRGFGRGLRRRVKETAAIGKTWMDGMGVGKAFEDQIQPWAAGYANKAARGLADSLMSGDRKDLVIEARLNILETFLETPIEDLLDEPDLARIDLRLKTAADIAGNIAANVIDQPQMQEAVLAFLKPLRDENFGDLMTRLGVATEAEDALLLALGDVGFGILRRPGLSGWLANEFDAVT